MAAPAAPPAFIEAPSYAEAVAAYPSAAAGQKIGGKARLRCQVAADRRLERCAVLGQDPKGYGFDDAARTLAQKLRLAPGAAGPVQVTLGFTPDMLGPAAGFVKAPAWAALPAVADFQATVPKTENGINNARVVLGCTVAAGGSLDGCAVESEEPAGQGFGQGALALAAKFKVAPLGLDGVPAWGARIRLPIRYALTPAPSPPPKP
jgi:TonB family protein